LVVFGKPVAIFVDGAFFLKRYRHCYSGGKDHSPDVVAKNMYDMLMRHVGNDDLYRIFYYDCPPLKKRAHNPISQRAIDFAKSDVALFREQFYYELSRRRKVALRLGELKDRQGWQVRPEKLKDLLARKISIEDLTDRDVYYDVVQKGVDIRIGLDIASLAYKRFVSKIMLVSGDSDFVPAAKLARREGIDVVLDPMWQRISPDLHLHIDGLMSRCDKPKSPEPDSDSG
jgi:uncharacterized LabA/DUF88 family protein